MSFRKPVSFAIVALSLAIGIAPLHAQEQQRPPVKWNNPDGRRPNGVEHGSFQSATMETEVGYNVWLPPGFAQSDARYPVMYFLHGAGGSENSDAGGFRESFLRLLEQEKIPPVICVFPNGGMSGYRDNPMTKVMGETLIINELVPLIDKTYRTKATREARLIAGFSMGGGGAVRLALRHPDLFSTAASWAGALGSRGGQAPPVELTVEHLRETGGTVRMLLIVGDQDSLFAAHKPVVENFEQANYPVRYKVLEGVGHNLGALVRQTGDEFVLFLAEDLQKQTAAAAPVERLAPSAVRTSRYPLLHGDGTVTFRVRAPMAKQVQIGVRGSGLGDKPIDLTKDAEGFWTVRTPVTPGFHYYQLLVDGLAATDPSSLTYFGWQQESSGLEVPDPALDFYTVKDVPHGDVRISTYHAKTTQTVRRAFVYTPPGYDTERDRRYPVLYLQHGAGESERGWSEQGKAQVILDNLIAAGRAVPMLIVMENGYATPPATPGAPSATGPAQDRFADLVNDDLIPFIDGKYRTLADREHRAIAGLSMGGGQALRIGLGRLDRFAWIGTFSGAVRNLDVENGFGGALRDADQANRMIRLLWIGCGTEDNLHRAAVAAHEALTKHKIDHVWFEGPGAHEWQIWRKHLYNFAPRLFRERTAAVQ